MKRESYEYVINNILDDMSRIYKKYGGELGDVTIEVGTKFINVMLSEYVSKGELL